MAFSDTCCHFLGRERNELECIYKTPPTYEHVWAKSLLQWWWHIDASLLQSVLDTCNLHLCYSCSSATLEHITYHIQRYNSQDFTITLQWGYPSWLLVDSFSISINNSGRARDSIRTLIVPGSQGEVNISVTYNIMHSISIVASNCAGNSDQSAALNIFKSEPQHTLCEH